MDKIYSDIHRTGTRSVVLSVTPKYCDEYRDPTLPIRDLKFLANLHGTRTLDSSDFSALCQHCQALGGIANITDIQAAQIEQRTRGQHTSSLWFAARAGTITASSMHSVYATDIHSPALSTVKRVCYPQRGPGTAATTWGIKQEGEAGIHFQDQPKTPQPGGADLWVFCKSCISTSRSITRCNCRVHLLWERLH